MKINKNIKTLTKSLIIMIMFLFLSHNSYSQNKSDSLKSVWKNTKNANSKRFNALNNYYNLYHFSKPDSTIAVTDYHYKLAEEKQSKEQMIRALSNKANTYKSYPSKLDTALIIYDRAEKLVKEINNTALKALIIGDKGIIYAKQKKYLEAIQHYASAQKMYQELKSEEDEARMFNNLATIYYSIGSYDLALKNYNKSLKFFNKIDSNTRKKTLLNINIGSIYLKQENIDKSLFFFKKALDIVEENEDTYFIAISNFELARVYLKDGQLEKANFHINKSLKIGNENNYKNEIFSFELTKAEIAYETNIEYAQLQAESILAKLDKDTSKDFKKNLYQLLYKCYKSQNETSKSLKMYELSTIYADSIQTEKNSFAIAREAVKADYEQKINKTKQLNQITQTKLKKKQSNKTNFIIAASTVLIILILLYLRSSNLKNKKEIETLLKEVESLKKSGKTNLIANSSKFKLDRKKIEDAIDRKLNKTDWKVLTIMLDDPVIPNKEIAEKAFMSVDGIGSSLRRMYEYFEVKESKYKKISLIMDAIKISNN